MKKICPLCLTIYEDENIEHCPKCNSVYNNLPKHIQKISNLEDYDKYDKRIKKLEDSSTIERKRLEKMMSQVQSQDNSSIQSSNIPKCPTCGSANIRHISSTERGVNAVLFGFFGNKRKCQFECLNPNCRYRW